MTTRSNVLPALQAPERSVGQSVGRLAQRCRATTPPSPTLRESEGQPVLRAKGPDRYLPFP